MHPGGERLSQEAFCFLKALAISDSILLGASNIFYKKFDPLFKNNLNRYPFL